MESNRLVTRLTIPLVMFFIDGYMEVPGKKLVKEYFLRDRHEKDYFLTEVLLVLWKLRI